MHLYSEMGRRAESSIRVSKEFSSIQFSFIRWIWLLSPRPSQTLRWFQRRIEPARTHAKTSHARRWLTIKWPLSKRKRLIGKRGGCESACQHAVHSAIGNERFDPHSMRFVPVGTGTDIHDQRHIQFCRCGHAFAHAGGDGIDAIGANFEDEFVVHLHNHACHLALWL